MMSNMPQVYQFRFFVRGISPVIWRRLLFRTDQTLVDMHYALQIVFNWSDDFLHQFHFRGRTYTVPREWGADTTHYAHGVSLQSLDLRQHERFLYEYNFFVWWQVEIRFEKQLDFDVTKTYPLCTGGKRAGPPEDCDGPAGYLSLREDKYHPIHLLYRLQEIARESEDDIGCTEWIRQEFPDLAYWLTHHKFNRRRINKCLKQYVMERQG